MTELQGAVALAQLAKLESMTRQRVMMAERLTQRIAGVPGVAAPKVTPGAKHVYWKYPLRVDPGVIRGGADAFGAKLKQAGIFCAPRYIQKLAFECEVLRDRNTFGKSHFPYVGEHRKGDAPVVYDKKETPGAVEALAGVVVLPWNEKYEPAHVDFIANAVRTAAEQLSS
jgi:dTDP-4-amino-4,6-dideoxygalactose transaminase